MSTVVRGSRRLHSLGGGTCSAPAGTGLVGRARLGGGGGGGEEGRADVFKVFSQDQVLQRLVEQIFGDFSGP